MKYRDWIRSQPCCVTGYIGDEIDPHHIKGYSWLTGGSMAKKGSDLTCIPLRHDLHNELHNNGWQTFEFERNMSQVEQMVKMILRAEHEGIITVGRG